MAAALLCPSLFGLEGFMAGLAAGGGARGGLPRRLGRLRAACGEDKPGVRPQCPSPRAGDTKLPLL